MSLRFEAFQTQWLQAGKAYTKELHLALQDPDSHEDISGLVHRCHEFYNSYTDMKIKAVKEDASYVAACYGYSPLEISFLWVGGWRPTTSVMLVYSLMGMHLQEDLAKILEGIDVPTMAALSGHQLLSLNSLQLEVRISEDELSHQLAILQMSMADLGLVKVTSQGPPPSESDDLSGFREALAPKLANLRDIVIEAEKLRSTTVERLIDILTPVQSVQYALAAMELTLAIRRLGVSGLLRQSIREMTYENGTSTNILKALQCGVDLCQCDYDGRKALHLAASSGFIECVKMLVKCGANIKQEDNSPLLAALDADVAKFLEKSGAETSVEDSCDVEAASRNGNVGNASESGLPALTDNIIAANIIQEGGQGRLLETNGMKVDAVLDEVNPS